MNFLTPTDGPGPDMSSGLEHHVRRALSLIDLREGSPNRGSADRDYWWYRTLTNFSGATWQQLGWPLALLASSSSGVVRERLAEASLTCWDWWASIQHSGGAFDEWYRNERSYCPTAFTSAGACESLHALRAIDRADGQADCAHILSAIRKACGWLEGRWNDQVMNQNLAAALALQSFSLLDSDPRWTEAARAKYARIAANQDSEGWFGEYRGADFGYSSLSLDLLALADRRGAPEAVSMAEKLAQFLWRVQWQQPKHPGRLGSRGTTHVFSFGARHFATHDRHAAALANHWSLAEQSADAAAADDRYFSYFHFPALVLAHLAPVAPVERCSARTMGSDDMSD